MFSFTMFSYTMFSFTLFSYTMFSFTLFSYTMFSFTMFSFTMFYYTMFSFTMFSFTLFYYTMFSFTMFSFTLFSYTMFSFTMLYYTMFSFTMFSFTMYYYTMFSFTMFSFTLFSYTMFSFTIFSFTMLYYTMFSFTMFYYTMFSFTLFSYTMFSFTMFSYTIFSFTLFSFTIFSYTMFSYTMFSYTIFSFTLFSFTIFSFTFSPSPYSPSPFSPSPCSPTPSCFLTMFPYTMFSYTMFSYTMFSYTMFSFTTFFFTMFSYTMFSFTMFSYTMFSFTTFFFPMFSFTMFSFTMFSYTVFSLTIFSLTITNFIPDRSRPGLTTTAIGAVDLQGAGGNWATVGRRSRGGRRVHRQREKRKGKSVGLRIGTLNVGTMTGKGRELADVMERRKVDILCVQETRWKGSKARSIGAGFKLFYYGVDNKRNGVGVVLKEEFVRNVLEVKRVSDRVMSLKLEIEGVMLNVVSGYAPQVGCELEEKERFWSELDEVMESIPTGERVVIGADFNGHVGEGNTGDEEVMGKFGVKERNLEGQMVVDFAKRMDMGVVNTYFQKREEHRVTYKSGGRRTQVDYILCRRGNLKEISDCKVVVGESVARQHRMVVCRMTLMVCKTKRSKIEKKTKWWKLKKEECCEEFRQKLRQALGGQVVLPDDWETTAEVIRETGRKVLGVSSGRRKEDKETWWWNEEVQDSIQRKRLAKKKWDMDRTEENRQEYKELQHRVKREVSKAKQKAYEELYTRLDTREGEKDLYRLARQRDRDGKDVQQVRVIKDRDGRVLTSEESVQRRWKEYFEELMNEENEREKRVEGVNSVEQKVDKIRKDEVRKALKRMKSGKAVGPDDIPVEVWKCLGEAAVEFLANLFNRVLESERMPEEWRRSVLVPIFKNKGDVQSCSNYRGIKLMSHTMKVWERVVEARLRKVVDICEQQYGFMPRKSTTDAIFALRILMEKYRDGQKELHCVFVDLEKAYDRVPREELWYCMRKSGVAEKYVRVVQDMYERSRTVVRCAVGQTEEFNVEVGLHQGSALSPFLFAIVMDQLSEEVRQESPWTMMFADDIVICSESREQVEENLERWRFALERRGMKVSRSKTEYMCVNEREGSGTVRLQGEEVKKVQEFKYLGSTVQSNGECGKEVKKRVQAGWNGWRKVSGVLCDQKISARIKGKVYRTVVRPAMLYGLETVSLRKRQESELEVAELKMLRFSLGVTRLDRIRNEYIRGTAHVGRLGDKVREARLRWFGHVQRRDSYLSADQNKNRAY
ncbi:hypothetical protein QTP86_002546 [Hemibagrus guttatus]|nr:hypothetical protein QTP86_002546 [Hemibagrus guttatus]